MNLKIFKLRKNSSKQRQTRQLWKAVVSYFFFVLENLKIFLTFWSKSLPLQHQIIFGDSRLKTNLLEKILRTSAPARKKGVPILFSLESSRDYFTILRK